MKNSLKVNIFLIIFASIAALSFIFSVIFAYFKNNLFFIFIAIFIINFFIFGLYLTKKMTGEIKIFKK